MQQSTLGVTRRELRDLVKGAGNKCVSIYIPVVKTEKLRREFELRAKETLKNLKSLLDDKAVIERAEEALKDNECWRAPGSTFALFVSDRMIRRYHLPDAVPAAEVHVGNEFYIRPLMRSVIEFRDVWLLGASKKSVRLFEVTGSAVREVDLPAGVPPSLEEMGRYTETFRGTPPQQQHTGTTGAQATPSRPAYGPVLGMRRAMNHGHNDIDDHMREILGTYMKRIEEGLKPLLEERGWPVIFSGPDELFHEFKTVFDPRFRSPVRLPVHPNGLSEDQAARLLAETLSSWTHEASRHSLERVRSGVKRVTSDVNEILAAAEEGRIISLFVLGDGPLWGSDLNGDFDKEAARLQVKRPEAHWTAHGKKCDGDFDLVNLALVRAARTGGTLRYVPVDRGPGESGSLYASLA